jgi:mRNA interferase RelE/StbE
MGYQLLIEKKAKKQLSSISEPYFTRIVDAIEKLSFEPRPMGSRKLIGRDGYRLRVGDYRIIYSIKDKELVIFVLEIGHRKDIYKG